jgi:hypothetical protein
MNNLIPFYIRDVNKHTMGESLYRYIEIKMHQFILNYDSYNKILVIGDYDRLSVISKKEKTDKFVNWQRPTAEIIDRTLYIKCFPGIDYVMHYASLIATYLALQNKNPEIVSYILPSPNICIESLKTAGLAQIPNASFLILGKVEKCLQLGGFSRWNENKGYVWSVSDNERICLMGCKFSFWGDIGYHLISILVDRGYQNIIFLGKLGSTRPETSPNMFIATGNESVLNGKRIVWRNMLAIHANYNCVVYGTHCTLSSVLLETKEWMKNNKKYDFVDPEIGHMAQAAIEKNINFSYLHIISDNLSKKYEEDLSNERKVAVIDKRKKTYGIMNKILSSFLYDQNKYSIGKN